MKRILCGLLVIFLLITSVLTMAWADFSSREINLKKLKDLGIIEGFENGELKGDEPLTRAQFAEILCKAFETTDSSEELKFEDVDKSHWAYDSIRKAVNSRWLIGYNNKTFGPDDNVKYEQALCVICRIIGIDVYEPYPIGDVGAAMERGLTEGTDCFIGEDITREEMATIIVNAQQYIEEDSVDYYGFKGYGTSAGYAGGGSANYDGMDKGMASVTPSMKPTGMVYDDIDTKHIVDTNREEYDSNDENVFKDAVTSPLSTFSIDTDTASYSNLRRFALNGQTVPAGSIRSEELINYFDYKGPDVKSGDVFGVKYEVGVCPWNKENQLAMITVQGEELTEYKPSNLVFLIDTSGSMYSYNKLPYVKKSLAMLLDKLSEKDTVSIVTYASGTEVVLEATPATEKDKILDIIDSLSARGSTAGASGINLAYDCAEKAKVEGNNRIILCTDGDFNVGISSQSELEELIEEKRKSGIYLSVLGFGMGNYKDNIMETLADKGNGNYAYIDNLKEAKKVLVDEMSKTIYTIAKDVKLQVEFNPAKVKSYRLVGYENRLLNNEDFANDKKDAGELGAGATVTVFYEIVPSDGTVEDNLKYQNAVVKDSDELMNVKIRYKLPDSDESTLREFPVSSEITSETSDDFKFAASVAELGMILNNSEYMGTATYDSVIDLAVEGKGEDKFGLRSEFVQIVDLLRYSSDK